MSVKSQTTYMGVYENLCSYLYVQFIFAANFKIFLKKFAAIRFGKLAKFDYGSVKSNMEHYGKATPPIYNMSNIPKNLPLFLSYGGKDKLSDTKDVQILLDSLRFHDVDKLDIQFVKEFAHADFIMGVTANNVVYNQMMAFFRNHQ